MGIKKLRRKSKKAKKKSKAKGGLNLKCTCVSKEKMTERGFRWWPLLIVIGFILLAVSSGTSFKRRT